MLTQKWTTQGGRSYASMMVGCSRKIFFSFTYLSGRKQKDPPGHLELTAGKLALSKLWVKHE